MICVEGTWLPTPTTTTASRSSRGPTTATTSRRSTRRGVTWRGEFRVPLSDAQLAGAVQGAVAHARGGATRDIGGEPRPGTGRRGRRRRARRRPAHRAGRRGLRRRPRRRVADGHGVRLSLSLAATPALLSVPWEFLYQRPRFLASQRKTPVVRLSPPASRPRRSSSTRRCASWGSSPARRTRRRSTSPRSGRESSRPWRTMRGWVASSSTGWSRRRRGGCARRSATAATTSCTSSATAPSPTPATVSCSSRTTTAGRGRRRDAARQPVVGPGPAAPRRPQLVRGRPHDDQRSVCRRGHHARRPRRAGGRRHAVRDQRRRGDRLRHRAVRQPHRPPDPIDAAVAEARKAVYSEVDPIEWATPVLFLRDPDVQLFDFTVGAAPLPPRVHRRTPSSTASSPRRRPADAAPAVWPSSPAASVAAAVVVGARRWPSATTRRATGTAGEHHGVGAPAAHRLLRRPGARADDGDVHLLTVEPVTCVDGTRPNAAHDVEPAWDRSTNRLAFRRLEPPRRCTGICYVVRGTTPATPATGRPARAAPRGAVAARPDVGVADRGRLRDDRRLRPRTGLRRGDPPGRRSTRRRRRRLRRRADPTERGDAIIAHRSRGRPRPRRQPGRQLVPWPTVTA